MNIARAAEERARSMRTPADRPQQRRVSEDPGSSRSPIRRAPVLMIRTDVPAETPTDALTFTGCASATECGYPMWDFFGEYTETVSAGAFGKTLMQTDLDVPLVIDHASGRRLARTTIPVGQYGHLQLVETGEGLMCSAALDPVDPDVAYIAPKIRSGLIDEMSFRFRILAGQWSPDFMEYRINEVDIHRGDVAIVGYGANPATSAQLRSLPELVRAVDDTQARQLHEILTARFAEPASPAKPSSRFWVDDFDRGPVPA